MNDLQIFSNPEFGKVRTINVDGEPWFVGIDVAKSLGYQKPLDAVNTNVDKEDTAIMGVCDANNHMQKAKCINESGLYSLIFGSKLDSAKSFKRWITSEVLPAIRKTGSYAIPDVPVRKIPDTSPSGIARLMETVERHILMGGGTANDILQADKHLFEVYGIPQIPFMQKFVPQQQTLFDTGTAPALLS